MKLFCADLPLKQRDFLRQKVIDDRIAFSDVVDQILYLPFSWSTSSLALPVLTGCAFAVSKLKDLR